MVTCLGILQLKGRNFREKKFSRIPQNCEFRKKNLRESALGYKFRRLYFCDSRLGDKFSILFVFTFGDLNDWAFFKAAIKT